MQLSQYICFQCHLSRWKLLLAQLLLGEAGVVPSGEAVAVASGEEAVVGKFLPDSSAARKVDDQCWDHSKLQVRIQLKYHLQRLVGTVGTVTIFLQLF